MQNYHDGETMNERDKDEIEIKEEGENGEDEGYERDERQ